MWDLDFLEALKCEAGAVVVLMPSSSLLAPSPVGGGTEAAKELRVAFLRNFKVVLLMSLLEVCATNSPSENFLSGQTVRR